MSRAARLLRCALPALLAAAGMAPASAATVTAMDDGRQMAIVPGPVPGSGTQYLERRNPDGSPDQLFGAKGRVPFTLGTGDSGATSIRMDGLGRPVLAGVRQIGPSRRVPVLARFWPDGEPDLTFGNEGSTILPVPAGMTGSATDLAVLADQSLLVLGQTVSTPGSYAALWRMDKNGAVEPGFGSDGVMLATAAGPADALGLAAESGGRVLIGLRRKTSDASELEVHRWQPGAPEPMRIARQPQPREWDGPVVLSRQGRGWQWRDASLPAASPGLPFATESPASAWRGVADAALVEMRESAPGGPAGTETGAAGWNPFAGREDAAASPLEPDAVSDNTWLAALALPLTSIVALAWWSARRGRASVTPRLPSQADSAADQVTRQLQGKPAPGPAPAPLPAESRMRLGADDSGTATRPEGLA